MRSVRVWFADRPETVDVVLQNRPYATLPPPPKAGRNIPRDARGGHPDRGFLPDSSPGGRVHPLRAPCSFAVRGRCPDSGQAAGLPPFRQGNAMQLTGAEIVIRCLQEEGVEYVFGYPGGAVLNIYDEFFKQDKVKHVLVRHEQGALHAADGYARATGRAGVALVTSGPGVTNAVTGIATAYMDSIPMVVITGQV